MIFGMNTQVTYIELEENDVNRRYILPNFENLVNKILTVIDGNPKVHLIRTGFATILSGPDTNVDSVSGLQAIPSVVSAVYTIRLTNHDVLGTSESTARYSEELTQLIGNAQPVYPVIQAPQVPVVETPVVQGVDLTAQLRAQMLSRKQDELNAPKAAPPAEPVTPSVPAEEPLPGQMKFEDFVAQKRAEQKPVINKALNPKPTGKIDILMEMVSELTEEVEELRLMLNEIRSGLGV